MIIFHPPEPVCQDESLQARQYNRTSSVVARLIADIALDNHWGKRGDDIGQPNISTEQIGKAIISYAPSLDKVFETKLAKFTAFVAFSPKERCREYIERSRVYESVSLLLEPSDRIKDAAKSNIPSDAERHWLTERS